VATCPGYAVVPGSSAAMDATLPGDIAIVLRRGNILGRSGILSSTDFFDKLDF
jgi:hypothetical protein